MSKRQKALLEAALICFLLATILMAFITTLNAEKAPTDTQHWQLLNGEDAWLITPPECNLQITEFGGSYYLTCVESKGE